MYNIKYSKTAIFTYKCTPKNSVTKTFMKVIFYLQFKETSWEQLKNFIKFVQNKF